MIPDKTVGTFTVGINRYTPQSESKQFNTEARLYELLRFVIPTWGFNIVEAHTAESKYQFIQDKNDYVYTKLLSLNESMSAVDEDSRKEFYELLSNRAIEFTYADCTDPSYVIWTTALVGVTRSEPFRLQIIEMHRRIYEHLYLTTAQLHALNADIKRYCIL